MYFLTEEERKQLLRGLLPKSRELGVAEEYRGWNWHRPPLEPIYQTKLAVYEVANNYCSTNRDLFLRRVQHFKAQPNVAMVSGSIFHQALVEILVYAKKILYINGLESYQKALTKIKTFNPQVLSKLDSNLKMEHLTEIKDKLKILTSFEVDRVTARIQEILAKQKYIGLDSLVATAIPVILEQKLNGSFLGLSYQLSTDAFNFSEPMVIDLKFGEPKEFHRLTTTGYALAMEAIYEFPVNLGCIVYVEFKDGRIVIQKDLHFIDEELRQWFIEARDDKARMIEEELDPGKAINCYPQCPYYSHCCS